MPELTREEQKAVIREALKEWADEKFMQFGKWSMTGAVIFAFTAIAYLYLSAHGFKP